jgi:hypothetical protein
VRKVDCIVSVPSFGDDFDISAGWREDPARTSASSSAIKILIGQGRDYTLAPRGGPLKYVEMGGPGHEIHLPRGYVPGRTRALIRPWTPGSRIHPNRAASYRLHPAWDGGPVSGSAGAMAAGRRSVGVSANIRAGPPLSATIKLNRISCAEADCIMLILA